MRINHILNESPDAKLLNDARLSKLIRIALMHDDTVSHKLRREMGSSLTDKKAMEIWLNILNNKINTGHNYHLVDQEKKFFEWMTRLYANNSVELEDLTSRGVESLMTWYVLSRRNKLKPADADFNKFPNFKSFERAMSKYNDIAGPFKDEEITKHVYKDAKDITLVDNDNYRITVPLNYGSSCKTARSVGPMANWCTGTLSTKDWFDQYFRQGPLLIFQSKINPEDKFQLHAPSYQFKDIKDAEYDKENFAKKYPDAMQSIIDGLELHKAKLSEIWPNMDAQINSVKNKFDDAFGKNIDESSKRRRK